MKKREKHIPDKVIHCWEFFHCEPSQLSKCLLSQTDEWRCWLVNIPCCKMDPQTPYPLSVKKVVCKNCVYYKTFANKDE